MPRLVFGDAYGDGQTRADAAFTDLDYTACAAKGWAWDSSRGCYNPVAVTPVGSGGGGAEPTYFSPVVQGSTIDWNQIAASIGTVTGNVVEALKTYERLTGHGVPVYGGGYYPSGYFNSGARLATDWTWPVVVLGGLAAAGLLVWAVGGKA